MFYLIWLSDYLLISKLVDYLKLVFDLYSLMVVCKITFLIFCLRILVNKMSWNCAWQYILCENENLPFEEIFLKINEERLFKIEIKMSTYLFK